MIDRDLPIPLYYQLKQYFRQQIEAGVLATGDRLPTEIELCEQFDISRAPVRQALTEMAREGLIYRRAGQGTFVAPQSQKPSKQQTTIRVLAHYDVRWMTSLENAVHQWNLRHPEQTAHLDLQMCDRGEYHHTLRHAVAQGNAPDIVPLDYVWVTDYAYAGYIKPLNSLDSVWVDEYIQDLELPVLKNNTVNGLLYGIPVQADISGLWYRKDWFDQEGLTPPQTWAEWLNAIDYFSQPEVKQRLGHLYSIVLPVTAAADEAIVNLLIPFIWANGGEIIDTTGKLALESTQVYEALHFLQSITIERRACMPENVTASHWWDLVRFFAEGAVPMALGGTYELPRMRDEARWIETEAEVATHLGFSLMPNPITSNHGVGSLGGTSWAILQQSSIPELSMEILKLMGTETISATFCKENLQIAPRRSVNAQLAKATHPWLSKVVPLLAQVRPRPRIPNYIQISRFLQQMFEQILWVGTPVEEAVFRTTQSLHLLLEG